MKQINYMSARAAVLLVALSGLSLSNVAHAEHADGYRLFAPLLIHSTLLHQQRQHPNRHHYAHQHRHQTHPRHQHHSGRHQTRHHYAPKKHRQHNHSYGRYSQGPQQSKHHRH